MVELTLRGKAVDRPYTVRLYGVTEEQFDELADDEDMKAELLDGVMIVHSPASVQHDDLSGFLRTLMRLYAGEKDAGIVLGPDSLVHLATCRKFGPDIFFVVQKHVPTPLPKEWEGAPDLVVEVLSPSNRADDLEDKRPAYREAGVREVWYVDPERQEVIVDRRRGRVYREEVVSKGRVASAALNGFWVETSWLWAEPLPREMPCLRQLLRGT